jgi:hypothetical protein
MAAVIISEVSFGEGMCDVLSGILSVLLSLLVPYYTLPCD